VRLHACDGGAGELECCGAHTDYGTFSIIFQDGQAGLEVEKPDEPGAWVTIPGDATVVLCGWCALILSGDRIQAARHSVRRAPGIRRFSAVLFVAPDLGVVLRR
jgi:isopenicillin N synthase-like dioxygenase